MTDWNHKDYIVCEAIGPIVPAYTTFFQEHKVMGHVRAIDETQAAKVVAAVTGRVRKYAVIEVTMVDLAASNPPGHSLIDEVANTVYKVSDG